MKLEMVLQLFLFSSIFLVAIAYYSKVITVPESRVWYLLKNFHIKKSFLMSIILFFVLFSFVEQKQKFFAESKTVQWVAQQAGNQATAKELTKGITYHSGKRKVIYYSQEDSRWSNEKYGNTDLISETGCGPTSLAMVISTLTDIIVTPKEMADWAYKNGYCAEGSGSYHTLIENAIKSFGLQVEQAGILDGQKIANALSNKKLVIVLMGKGTFTSSGHFIVLNGITEEGEVFIADPKSEKNTQQTFPLGLILSEAKGGTDSLGPFWIIY